MNLENRKILFAYKDVPWDDGKLRKVTFAGEINENHLRIGFAIASPNENNYQKSLGREIAVGRMEKKPLASVELNKDINPYKLFKDYVSELDTTTNKLAKYLNDLHLEKVKPIQDAK